MQEMQDTINHKLAILQKKKDSGEIGDFIAFAMYRYCHWECGDRLFLMQFMFDVGENKEQAAEEYLAKYQQLHEEYKAKVAANGYPYLVEEDFSDDIKCAEQLIRMIEEYG